MGAHPAGRSQVNAARLAAILCDQHVGVPVGLEGRLHFQQQLRGTREGSVQDGMNIRSPPRLQNG